MNLSARSSLCLAMTTLFLVVLPLASLAQFEHSVSKAAGGGGSGSVNMPIPFGPITSDNPFLLDITTESSTELEIVSPDGTSSFFSWSAAGGSVTGTDTVTLEKDKTYIIKKTNFFSGSTDSLFISGTFTFDTAEEPITWEVTPDQTSTYTIEVNDQATDFTATVSGTNGLAGSSTAGAVGPVITVATTLEAQIGKGAELSYTVTFNGTINTLTKLSRENRVPEMPAVTIVADPAHSNPENAYEMSTLAATHDTPSDPDGDAVSVLYSWFVNGTQVPGVSGNELGQEHFSAGDTVKVEAVASDGIAESAPQSDTIAIVANAAPVVTVVPSVFTLVNGRYEINENQSGTLAISVADSDGPTPLTWKLVGAIPAGATLTPDPNPNSFAWTPPYSTVSKLQQTRDFSFAIEAEDGAGGTVMHDIALTVKHVDVAPLLTVSDSSGPVEDYSVEAGGTVTLTLEATDTDTADGGTLTFSRLPVKGTLAATNAAVTAGVASTTFSWTPTQDDKGNRTFFFQVKDADSNIGVQEVVISVDVANRPPKLVLPDSLAMDENATQTISGISATDPDGDAVAIEIVDPLPWLNGGGTAVTGGQIVADLTGLYEHSGSYAISIRAKETATDDGTPIDNPLFDQGILQILVEDVNRPPVWDSAQQFALSLSEGEVFTESLLASDPDKQDRQLTFAFSTATPAGLTLDGNTLGWTPTFEQGQSTAYEFDVTVSDTRGGETTETFALTVGNVNRPPRNLTVSKAGVANTSFTMKQDETLPLTLNATDPDAGTALTYSVSPAETWLAISGSDATATTPPPGFYALTFTATDGSLSVSANISLEVKPVATETLAATVTQVGTEAQRVLGVFSGGIPVNYTVTGAEGTNVSISLSYVTGGVETQFATDVQQVPASKEASGSVDWVSPEGTGLYSIKISAVNTDTPTQTASGQTSDFQVDNQTPPAPSITPFAKPQAGAVVVSGTMDTTSEPYGVTVDLFDQTGDLLLGSIDVNSPWSLNVSGLEDGEHSLVAFAVDRAGHRSSPSAPVILNVDTNAPSISFTAPTLQNGRISKKNPSIQVSVSDDGAGLDLTSAKILVNHGSEQKTLFPSYTPSDGNRSGTLNATLSLAAFVTYTVVAEIDDLTGKHLASDSLTMTVDPFASDTVPPTASISQPAADSKLNSSTVQFVGRAEDEQAGVDPDTIEVKLDGVLGTHTFDPGTGQVIASFTGVPDGSHTIVLAVSDNKGNGPTSQSVSFVVDITPPLAPILTGLPTDWTNSPGSVQANVAASGADKVTLFVNGEPVQEGAATPLSQLLNGSLRQGDNIVSAFLEDDAGNRGPSVQATVKVDTENPRIAAAEFQADSVAGLLRVSAFADDPLSGVGSWSVTIDSEPAIPGTGATISAEVAFDSATASVHTATITVQDSAGNSETTTKTLNYTPPVDPGSSTAQQFVEHFVGQLDLIPPEIRSILPGSGTIIGVNSVTIVVDAVDEAGTVTIDSQQELDSLKASVTAAAIAAAPPAMAAFIPGIVDNLLGNPPLTLSSIASGLGSKTLTLSRLEAGVWIEVATASALVLSQTGLAEGQYRVTALISDSGSPFANSALEISSFAVDTTAPSVTLALETLGGTPIIGVTGELVTNASGLTEPGATVDLIRAGGGIVGRTSADAAGNYTIPNVSLVEGENVFQAIATDSAGNQGSSVELAIRRDTVPPEILLVSPTDGSRLSMPVGGIILKAILADDGESISGSFFLNGSEFVGTYANGELTATGTGLVNNSTNTVKLDVADQAGNTNSVSWEFIVDSQAPQIALSVAGVSVITNPEPRITAGLDVAGDRDIDFSTAKLYWGSGAASASAEAARSASSGEPYSLIELLGELFYDPAPLQDTEFYSVEVTVRDLAGNEGSATATFQHDVGGVDDVPPVILSAYPGPGVVIDTTALEALEFVLGDADSGFSESDTIIEINGVKYSLEELISTGQARSYGNRVVVHFRKMAPISGALLNPLELSQFERSLASGTNTIRVVAADKAGNLTEQSWSFTVQTDPPAIPVLEPITSPTASQTASVKGTVAGVSATNPVSVVAMVNGLIANRGSVASDGGFAIGGVSLSAGSNTIQAYAVDSVGNQSVLSTALILELDQTAPVITLQSPHNGAQLNIAQSVVSASIDDLTVTDAMVVVNGDEVVAAVTDGIVSQEVTLLEGTNTIQVNASDALGNIGTSRTISVTVVTAIPETAPAQLLARVASQGTQIALTWTADANAATYNIYRQDVPITEISGLEPIFTGVAGTSFVDSRASASTTYYYAITSTNAAGTEGTAFTATGDITLVLSQSLTNVVIEDTELILSAGSLAVDASDVAQLTVRGLAELEPSVQQRIADADENTPGLDIPAALEDAVWLVEGTTQAGSVISGVRGLVSLALPTSETPNARILMLGPSGWEVASENQTTSNGVVASEVTQLGVFRVGVMSTTPSYDVNADASVDILDLTQVGLHFGEEGIGVVGDVNADGVVDILDLTQVGLHFGETFGVSSTAPVSPDAPQMTLSMSAIRTLANDYVELSVMADRPELIRGFQFDLGYDGTQLDLVRVIEGGALKQRGNTYWIEPATAPGYIRTRSVLLGRDNQQVASNVLTRIILKVSTDNPVEALRTLELSSVTLADRVGALLRVRIEQRVGTDGWLFDPTSLGQNYPNPFNPETWIPYTLQEDAAVVIRIHSPVGQLVRSLQLGHRDAGDYTTLHRSAHWDGRNDQGEAVASGTYFYTMTAGDFTTTRKMVILK